MSTFVAIGDSTGLSAFEELNYDLRFNQKSSF